MAQRHLVQLVDDLDGSVIDGNGRTVKFGFEGKSYEIDLSDTNAGKLREVLAPFVKAGRTVASPRGRASTSRGKSSDLAAIRAWANANGFKVGDRGRIPEAVRAAFSAR
jgi:hypothetical protein